MDERFAIARSVRFVGKVLCPHGAGVQDQEPCAARARIHCICICITRGYQVSVLRHAIGNLKRDRGLQGVGLLGPGWRSS
jgi:hypothetical protein